MSDKEYYVTLTGGKNNAGDFLIKHRGMALFNQFRKDRSIVDFNGWEILDDQKLDVINKSNALILLGGPALVKSMVPNIYNLADNLENIKVPIIAMGIGWNSPQGNWNNTYNYPLNNDSIKLLKRVNESGYYSSVRDYQTLNVLRFKGFDKFLMTGCPAYYDTNFLNKDADYGEINRVAFSTGVSFVRSRSMERLLKDNILTLKEKLHDKKFEVVFHHSLNSSTFSSAYKGNAILLKKHKELADWLMKQNITYVDISGSAKKLIQYYSEIDFHIGYRVHAHIFMNSISKRSILISEDGRAKGSKSAIGGVVLDSFLGIKEGLIFKVMERAFGVDRYMANNNLSMDIMNNFDYELISNYTRIRLSKKAINYNFDTMEKFIGQLP